MSPLVFPSDRNGGVLAGWSKLVPALRRASGMDFTLHDLPRTCRTLMSHHRVEFEIAELAIGHKRKGLDAIYNFDQAWKLRCEAFEKVSDHVAGLLDLHGAGKVVAMVGRTS